MDKIYFYENDKQKYIKYIRVYDDFLFLLKNNRRNMYDKVRQFHHEVDIRFIKKLNKVHKIVDQLLFFIPYDIIKIINEYSNVMITVNCTNVLHYGLFKKITFSINDSHNYFVDTFNKNIVMKYVLDFVSITKFSEYYTLTPEIDNNMLIEQTDNYTDEKSDNNMILLLCGYDIVLDEKKFSVIMGSVHRKITIINNKIFKNISIILHLLISVAIKYSKNIFKY